MLQLLRYTYKPVLIFCIIVIGASFFFFGAPTMEGPQGGVDIGRIRGRPVGQIEYDDSWKAVMIFAGANAENEMMVMRATWQSLLLQHYAKEIGVVILDADVEARVRELFSQNGTYDPARYRMAINFLQDRYNVGQAAFLAIMRSQLAVDRAREAIVSPILIEKEEVDEVFRKRYGPVTIQVATLDSAKFRAQVKVSDAEIKEAYEQTVDSNPDYRTPERRKVQFVKFEMTEEQQKLEGQAKDRAREELARQALEFALSLELPPGAPAGAKAPSIEDAARAKSLVVQETEFFAADEPAKPLPPSPNIAAAAFKLRPERPHSPHVPLGDTGFVVLKLAAIEESKAKPLEEVKSLVETALINERSSQAMIEQGRKDAEALKAAVGSGQSFEAKAKELGLAIETLPPFAPGDRSNFQNPKLRPVLNLGSRLAVGEVSMFIPTANGGMIARILSRGEPDETRFANDKKTIREQLESQAKVELLEEWFRIQEGLPGTQPPKALQAALQPPPVPPPPAPPQPVSAPPAPSQG
jgi:hypothetical protein